MNSMSLKGERSVAFLWMLFLFRITELTKAYVRPSGTCVDSVYAIPGHTMCIANTRQHPIHQTERNDIVKALDDIRANVTPSASNMLKLIYLSSLDKEAQIWAEQCTFTHDEPHLRQIPGRFTVGQNILVSNTSLTWQRVIETWATEKRDFHYGQTNDINVVGNYVQLINAETLGVGCGVTVCGGTYFYVCNYAPSVNLGVNFGQPYNVSASGLGADDCPRHVSNMSSSLCDCDGLMCINGGTVNLTTCLCDCPPDSTNQRYNTRFCEMTCEPPTDPIFCQSKNKGQCRTDPETFMTCPWLCNVCPYAGMNYTQGDVSMPWTTTDAPSTYTTPTSTTSQTSASLGSFPRHITSQAASGNGLAKGQTDRNGGLQFVTTVWMMAGSVVLPFLLRQIY